MGRKPSADRRLQILTTARRLFGMNGYRDTTIAQIALEAGVGPGTIYRYFRDKRSLFDEVMSIALSRVIKVTQGRKPDAPHTLAQHQVEIAKVGWDIYSTFVHDTAEARVVFYEAPRMDATTRGMVTDAFSHLSALTEAYLRNGRKRGYLQNRFDEHVTAKALTAIVMEGIRDCIEADDHMATAQRWITSYEALCAGLAQPKQLGP